MTSKVKERLLTVLINSGVTLCTVFLAFGLNSSYQDNMDIEKKIDGKLDKQEFSDYKEGHENRHKRESITNEKFLEQLDKRFDQQNESINLRFDDLKDYIKNHE
jgi:hypothetical protein